MADHLAFIVSGGRTGTQFLGDLLMQAIDDSWSEHEPDMVAGLSRKTIERIGRFGLWHMVFGRTLGHTGVRVAGTRYLTGRATFEQTKQRLRAERAGYHRSTRQALLIESYYAWWMVAPRLEEIFPGAKVAGVVRDPRTWIASWLSRDASRDSGHWTHLLPPGRITPATTGDTTWASRWEEIGPVGRLAWQWRLVNGAIAEAETNAGAALFRFEDLFSAGSEPVLRKLCDHVATFPDKAFAVQEVDALKTSKRNQSGATGTEWESWSPAERQVVQDLCGPLMERFGYAALEG